jgi:hypothetical protein
MTKKVDTRQTVNGENARRVFYLPKLSPSTQGERCEHTSLKRGMCAHCNLRAVPSDDREPFRGMGTDDTPRLFKGRDIVEWRGRGKMLGEWA